MTYSSAQGCQPLGPDSTLDRHFPSIVSLMGEVVGAWFNDKTSEGTRGRTGTYSLHLLKIPNPRSWRCPSQMGLPSWAGGRAPGASMA